MEHGLMVARTFLNVLACGALVAAAYSSWLGGRLELFRGRQTLPARWAARRRLNASVVRWAIVAAACQGAALLCAVLAGLS